MRKYTPAEIDKIIRSKPPIFIPDDSIKEGKDGTVTPPESQDSAFFKVLSPNGNWVTQSEAVSGKISAYTLKSETAAISSSLYKNKIDKGLGHVGKWNNVIVNSDGIVTSGSYVDYIGQIDLSPFELKINSEKLYDDLSLKLQDVRKSIKVAAEVVTKVTTEDKSYLQAQIDNKASSNGSGISGKASIWSDTNSISASSLITETDSGVVIGADFGGDGLLRVGGTTSLAFLKNDKVLIGSNSPKGTDKLQVTGSISSTDTIKTSINSSDSNGFYHVAIVDGSLGSTFGNTSSTSGGRYTISILNNSGPSSITKFGSNYVTEIYQDSLCINNFSGPIYLGSSDEVALNISKNNRIILGSTIDNGVDKLQVIGSVLASGDIVTSSSIKSVGSIASTGAINSVGNIISNGTIISEQSGGVGFHHIQSFDGSLGTSLGNTSIGKQCLYVLKINNNSGEASITRFGSNYDVDTYKNSLYINNTPGPIYLGSAGLVALSVSSDNRVLVGSVADNGADKLQVTGTIFASDRLAASNIKSGKGAPEGVIIGSIGDVYQQTDGSLRTSLYVKEKGINNNTGWKSVVTELGVIALIDSPTIETDSSLADTFSVIITDNRMMGNPTNCTNGKKILYRITQDNVGNRTMSWAGNFRFSVDVPVPTLSTNPDATDYIEFIYNSSVKKWDCLSVRKGY